MIDTRAEATGMSLGEMEELVRRVDDGCNAFTCSECPLYKAKPGSHHHALCELLMGYLP